MTKCAITYWQGGQSDMKIKMLKARCVKNLISWKNINVLVCSLFKYLFFIFLLECSDQDNKMKRYIDKHIKYINWMNRTFYQVDIQVYIMIGHF